MNRAQQILAEENKSKREAELMHLENKNEQDREYYICACREGARLKCRIFIVTLRLVCIVCFIWMTLDSNNLQP